MTEHVLTGPGAPADEVVRYVSGSIFSSEWTNRSVTPESSDGKRHYFNHSSSGGVQWRKSLKEEILGLDFAGPAGLGLGSANWFGIDGTVLSWTWRASAIAAGEPFAPFPYNPGAGHKALFEGRNITPRFADIPDFLLGACKINDVYVIATAGGIYYRPNDGNQWNLITGTENIFDFVAYIHDWGLPSQGAAGWGPVRFSGNGSKGISIGWFRHDYSQNDYNYDRRLLTFSLSESEGIVSISDVVEQTDVISQLSALNQNISVLQSTSELNEWSGVVNKGDDLPFTIAADWDGEELVELQVDLRNVSGSLYKYCAKYQIDAWKTNVLRSMEYERYYLVKKEGGTIYDYFAGKFSGNYEYAIDQDQAYPYEMPISFARYEHDGFHIGFADLRKQILLGVRITKDALADNGFVTVQSGGALSQELTDETTIWQPPAIVVKTKTSEYIEAIGQEAESFFIEDSPSGAGYYYDYFCSLPTEGVSVSSFLDGLIMGRIFMPSAPNIGIEMFNAVPIELYCYAVTTKDGDILFSINTRDGYVSLADDKKYRTRAYGLFRASTNEFTKLTDLYDPDPLGFPWDWITHQEYISQFYNEPLPRWPLVHRNPANQSL